MDINDSGFSPFNSSRAEDHEQSVPKQASKKAAKSKAKPLPIEDSAAADVLDDKLIEVDSQKKQQLATSCMNYFNSKVFGTYLLKDCGFTPESKRVNKMEIDELKSLLKRLQTAVGLKNSGKATKTVALKVVQALEMALEPTVAKCPGTSAVLDQSEEFNELIEELRLEMSLGVISAKTRLALLVIQTAYTQNVIARDIQNNPDRYKKLAELAKQAQAN